LGRNAREFIERVQKDQERLLGKHLLRRKVEEGRRSQEEGEMNRRATEQDGHKREERKLKAESNLLLIKERVKLAKLINRHELDSTRPTQSPNDVRFSLRDKEDESRREDKCKKDAVVTDRLVHLKD
jgi:exonuclease III